MFSPLLWGYLDAEVPYPVTYGHLQLVWCCAKAKVFVLRYFSSLKENLHMYDKSNLFSRIPSTSSLWLMNLSMTKMCIQSTSVWLNPESMLLSDLFYYFKMILKIISQTTIIGFFSHCDCVCMENLHLNLNVRISSQLLKNVNLHDMENTNNLSLKLFILLAFNSTFLFLDSYRMALYDLSSQ